VTGKILAPDVKGFALQMALDNAALLEPLSADAPCGVDLDVIGGLAVLDAMQIFGQRLRPLGELVPTLDPELPPALNPIKQYRWPEVLNQAGSTLALSKDFQVLAHAAAAALRVDGFESFTQILEARIVQKKESTCVRLRPDGSS
jgi:hypothetical protein